MSKFLESLTLSQPGTDAYIPSITNYFFDKYLPSITWFGFLNFVGWEYVFSPSLLKFLESWICLLVLDMYAIVMMGTIKDVVSSVFIIYLCSLYCLR